MAVPYTFGSATAAIPLSNLDSNFSTTITLGNTAIQLGNTVTTLNNMTLANATISSGNVTLTNVTVTTANVTTGNITTLVVGSGGIKSSGNVVVGTTTDFTSATVPGAMEVAGYGIYPYVNRGTTNTTDYTGFNWYTPTAFAGNNGASTQTIHAYSSILNVKNDGTGGTNAVVGNGFTALVNAESSASTARLTMRGLNLSIGRSQAADLSTSASNLITGSLMSVGHFAGALSTINTNSVYGYNTTSTNNGGNITTQASHIITVNVGGATANTAVSTSAYSITVGTGVGAATGNTATVTTGASFYANGPTVAATGTMTTYYGLYLGSSTVTGTLTNNYGVYSADTAATNYFGGSVGIGTTSPTHKLTVKYANNGSQLALDNTGQQYTALNIFNNGTQKVGMAYDNTNAIFQIDAIATSSQIALLTADTERMRIDGSGNVGIGTSSPNASAILDAQSTTKGVRMPNMTTTQKNAISSPAAGLMVFDTTLSKLCVYSGAAWQTITSV